MAAREGQGLQIAVIIFAMLTIILAVTTYIFYAQGQTAMKEKDDAIVQAGAKQQEVDKLFYKVRAMQMALGLASVGDAEVQLAKAKPGVGEDQEVTDLLNKFKADMLLVADQVAPTEKRDYVTVANILMNVVNKRGASITDANVQTRDVQTKSAAALAAADVRAQTAETAVVKAQDDLKTEQGNLATQLTSLQTTKTTLEASIAATNKAAADNLSKVTKQRDDAYSQTTTQQVAIDTLGARMKELQKGQVDLFENPDGKIQLVSQKQRLVWLNVGRADGLMRQTTFSVYDHDENGVASAEGKARIEVVEVSGDHLSEARILEDSAANPILPGDIIHTPSWSPGQRIHFAMAGKMDINGDGIDDYDMVKNVIRLNGGEVDAELRPTGERTGKLSVNTRYLVLGDRPDERAADNAKLLAEYTKIQEEIKRYGIDTLPVKKLLSLMGWKSEERTVELAGSRGGGEFRKRAPGKTAPAGTPAPAGTTPAPTATPAPVGGIDPFAPATPAAPAAPAADPFGAPVAPPAPMPMPPPAANPFGG